MSKNQEYGMFYNKRLKLKLKILIIQIYELEYYKLYR